VRWRDPRRNGADQPAEPFRHPEQSEPFRHPEQSECKGEGSTRSDAPNRFE